MKTTTYQNNNKKNKNNIFLLMHIALVFALSIFFVSCARQSTPQEDSGGSGGNGNNGNNGNMSENVVSKLIPGDGHNNSRFGYAVDVDGNTAIIGAFWNDGYRGSAYIFHRANASAPWTQQAKLNSSRNPGDRFGFSVAISGNTVIVGADGDGNTSNRATGAAYVFTRSGTTWTQQARLVGNDSTPNSAFGNAVDIDGNIVVVGSHLQSYNISGNVSSNAIDTSSLVINKSTGLANTSSGIINSSNILRRAGAAYIFTRSGTTWAQQAKLTPRVNGERICYVLEFLYSLLPIRNIQERSEFGISVAISGTTAIVGAWKTYGFYRQIHYHNCPTFISGCIVSIRNSLSNNLLLERGAAYIFTQNTSGTNWIQQAKLNVSDAGFHYDRFGVSVDIDGNTSIIGAYQGAVQDFTINSSNGTPGLGTGIRFNISTRQQVHINRINNAGFAYIFTRSGTTWTQQQRIHSNDGSPFDEFGVSVGISGNTAVVGAWHDEDNRGENTGSAYIFTRSGTSWTQSRRLTASDRAAYDVFGISVAIGGNSIMVGAYGDDRYGDNSGAAYVFPVR